MADNNMYLNFLISASNTTVEDCGASNEDTK